MKTTDSLETVPYPPNKVTISVFNEFQKQVQRFFADPEEFKYIKVFGPCKLKSIQVAGSDVADGTKS